MNDGAKKEASQEEKYGGEEKENSCESRGVQKGLGSPIYEISNAEKKENGRNEKEKNGRKEEKSKEGRKERKKGRKETKNKEKASIPKYSRRKEKKESYNEKKTEALYKLGPNAKYRADIGPPSTFKNSIINGNDASYKCGCSTFERFKSLYDSHEKMNKKLEEISSKLDIITNFGYFMEDYENENQSFNENFKVNNLIHD